MKTAKLALAVLPALLLAWSAAADEGEPAPEAPVAPYATGGQELVGPMWRLTELNGELAAEDVETTLDFSEDGQIGGNGGCNAYGGDYEISGEDLTFSNVFSTLMACPDEKTPQERAFFDVLEQTRRYEVAEGELLLKGEEDTILARLAEQTP